MEKRRKASGAAPQQSGPDGARTGGDRLGPAAERGPQPVPTRLAGPAFCTECPIEDALTAIESGTPLRREDWCDRCWATLSTALGLDHGSATLPAGAES